MANSKFDFNKSLIKVLILYAAIFIVGIIIACVFGVKLDINFRGGTRLTYSYSGEVEEGDIKEIVKENVEGTFSVSKSTSLAGDTNTFTISLAGNKSLSAETQTAITTALQEKYADGKIEIYDSNSVSPTIAGTFLLKSFVAVILTAILVVIYVGIRFKKIGGISAALTALCALVLDLLVTFFVCVIFRLQIDSNYIAVVLTILGYSLNDTIVVYDRVRENRRQNPEMVIGDIVNMSITKVLVRNIVTTITTVLAVITIIVVSEIYGLTSLRTFAIPMAFGLLSGCFSSVFVAGPLWVKWKEHKANKAKA
ncbi:MAG: protein translocase subunit SecF [Clostridia bacterium]|nr:protein translocase subunit SecF [Clostridia bacterium]